MVRLLCLIGESLLSVGPERFGDDLLVFFVSLAKMSNTDSNASE